LWTRPVWLAILSDLVSIGLGMFGAIHEILFTTSPDLGRLGLYGVFITAPGLLAAKLLGPGASSSSQPPSPASPSSSPSSSGGSGG